MTKSIIYSASSYTELRRDNGYFVDKTEYIAKLERVKNAIFLRPRRFGKSFMCSMLHAYYDVRGKDEFEELFGDTWIGQNPTGQQSKYIILHLNFSDIEPGPTLADIEASFKGICNEAIDLLRVQYAPLLDALPPMDLNAPVSRNLSRLTKYTEAMGWPPLYVIIDEYDNFANQLIINRNMQLYHQLTDDTSFLKTFFKVLKSGREIGAIYNIYITGILPITIGDLASAFNIGTYLTLDPTFEAMIGFTQPEVDSLLDQIFEDFTLNETMITGENRAEIGDLIKANYNGYHFVRLPEHDESTAVYNTTILMYFLRYLTEHREVTIHLADSNLKTDVGWYRLLNDANPELGKTLVDQLMFTEQVEYSPTMLTSRFRVAQFFDAGYFQTALFYLGLLTRQSSFRLTFPNHNMHEVFVEYFNERYKLNTSDPFKPAAEAFIQQPDLEMLFHAYWQEYIGKLPEAIFTQVNENFYRTTFYEVCMRNLHEWFTWNLERSYPKGKSDLEFVGKHHQQFAGMRWVIEFKYYSKKKMREEDVDVKTFALQKDDTKQINGYVEGLIHEYPEANVSKFVIYCFANVDFRIFEVD
ncbi:MAG: AAA family ATPase [Chloroflexota bacterium]